MRTKDPDSRRGDILKAALALFREEGFDKVSVESIAKNAGIAKGSFYNYFKTKEEVYEAAIADIAAKNLYIAEVLLSDKSKNPKERLKQYIDWTFKLTRQQEKSLSRVLTQNANDSQRQMYLRALDGGNALMFPIFERLLEEGASSGIFDLSESRFTAVIMLGAFRNIHVSFYDGLEIDMKTGRALLDDFLSRLLGTEFGISEKL